MKTSDIIHCTDFPCLDVDYECHHIPDIQFNPDSIKVLMISEAPSKNIEENFYSTDNQESMRTTIQIFRDAGFNISRIQDLIDRGIYITTAIKCPKKEYAISSKTIQACSILMEKELDQLKNIKAIVCNGDVAIKVLNCISKQKSHGRIIPAGSTYKIRNNKYYYHNIRVFPSYILTGKNILIEKSKRRMITEDLKEALNYI